MLKEGMTGKHEIVVTEEMTAKHAGSGTLEVFATPAMIALMEQTAWKRVADELEEGCATVGTALNIRHTAATPVGMKVTCETKLLQVQGRVLTFEVKAYDACGLIGEGTHERVIIQEKRFQEKADAKIAESGI